MSRRSLARFLAALLLAVLVGGPAAAQTPSPEQEAPAVRVLPTGGLRVESAALLVSGQQGGSIHVAVLALPFPGEEGEGGRARVPVVLEIDGTSLLAGQSGELLRFEVCLYALSATGSVQGSLLETVEVDLARRGGDVARSGVQYLGELELPAGDHSLRVLVRNALTGEVGLRILPLAVPERPKGLRALLLPPVFPNPPNQTLDAWVEARSPARAGQTSPATLAGGGLPAAQPVLGVGQEARFELPAYGVIRTGELQVEILRPDGGRVTQLPARVEARQAGAEGLERLTVSFVPTGLEAGRYALRALLPRVESPSFAAAADTLSYAAPFVLLSRGNEGKVWAELLDAGRGPSTGSAGESRAAGGRRSEAPRRRSRLDAGPVRTAYRQALRLLATGDEPAARRAVADLEGLLLGGRSASPEELADLEVAVAQDLAAADPRSLIPVVLLHQSLYREAQARRETLLSTHSRELVFRLAEVYAKRSGDAGRAARLLLALAADLIGSAPPGLRDRALRQVLAFDETSVAALLCLAVEAERKGRYPEAVDLLHRLLRADPAHGEGRLRLAVSLRRLGKARDADRLLSGLVQAPPPQQTPQGTAPEPWVLSLAYHELARAQIAANRLEEAEELLREGRRLLPEDEKLALLLAQVHELRRDPVQAREVLAGVKPGTGQPAGDSARHRYNRPPYELLDRIRAELVESLPEHLPTLAAALGTAAERGGS